MINSKQQQQATVIATEKGKYCGWKKKILKKNAERYTTHKAGFSIGEM